MAYQITSLMIVYSTVYSATYQRKAPRHWPCAGNSPKTGEFPAQRTVTRKMFPFDDFIMTYWGREKNGNHFPNDIFQLISWYFDAKSTKLITVCQHCLRWATCRYLKHYWLSFITHIFVTRPQRAKWFPVKHTNIANLPHSLRDSGTNSRTLSITTGVPQGSILGPLLFIIYMNDIHNASSKFHAILFADDTNLTSTLCSFDVNIDNKCNSLQLSTNINKELKNIQIWLEINKLSLNVKKTKFMIFHHKQRNIENLIPQLNLNEQIIERVTDFDFLGLTIDQHLTWNGHVQKISNKISRSLGIMCKLKRFLPQNILKILYNSLILPHLQYCILSWGFKSDRIFKLQKRAVRIITCSKHNAHTEPLLKTLNLLKIEDIMKTKALKLYYRYKQNELPKYFESMFTESNDNHSRDTRHKSLLYQLPTKTSTGRLCIRHYIPELLSKTPECITEKLDTHSFSGFSNYMKNFYIRNYNENCLIENCYICQK